MSRIIVQNKQNLERCVLLQITCLHVAGTAIQVCNFGEGQGHPWLLISPVGHWKCMFDMLEGPGFALCSITRSSPVACNMASKQDCYLVLKSLKTWDWLNLMHESPIRHLFPEYRGCIHSEYLLWQVISLPISISQNSSATFTSALLDIHVHIMQCMMILELLKSPRVAINSILELDPAFS